jgi:hypothetical protein
MLETPQIVDRHWPPSNVDGRPAQSRNERYTHPPRRTGNTHVESTQHLADEPITLHRGQGQTAAAAQTRDA